MSNQMEKNLRVIEILNKWGPEAIEKGFITEKEVYKALGSSSDKGSYKNMKHGGMMNMDKMTRPLGYAAGGPIPKNEFDVLMAEFDTPENRAGPGEPVGLEKIIAEKYAVDPRHTLPDNFPVDSKFLAREMGGDQGSAPSLSREELEGLLKSLRISLMIAEGTATPSFLGGGSSQQIKELENKIRQIELELQ